MKEADPETLNTSQETAKAIGTGRSGTICTKTGLYTATDGRIQFVTMVEAGNAYPAFPGGTANSSASWRKVGTAEASKTSFDAVTAPAGSTQ
jgi:hypothetical protein